MEELVCPTCGKKLDKIQEEYHSIGVYIYLPEKDRYKIEDKRRDITEVYSIKCPFCGNPLPSSLQLEVEKKLPKV